MLLSENMKVVVNKSAAYLIKPIPEAMPVVKKSGCALAFIKHATTEYEEQDILKLVVQCNTAS